MNAIDNLLEGPSAVRAAIMMGVNRHADHMRIGFTRSQAILQDIIECCYEVASRTSVDNAHDEIINPGRPLNCDYSTPTVLLNNRKIASIAVAVPENIPRGEKIVC